ncbi:nucleoid-associated protein [Chryseosolibacter indicus]|uniref:Nucleoid-associated protein n=1 Tax=Chryseosolibacter indicus TaxID=2782351 RepID=A0ABS5VQE3_9BACT|nr:nucleoid-associated protein [Chryseosolibacter indicus]MBT1703663.1 nucleoid-associated protein [Chryseosolibacter indicus]
MLDFGEAKISKLIIHKVGNKILEDGVQLSDEIVDVSMQPELSKVLHSYFLSPFKEPIYYNFHHVTSLDLNEVYTIAMTMFDSATSFVEKSKDLANILYEYSDHPKIKTGELYIVHFEDCNFKNEFVDAIGIFKSENKDTFLKILEEETQYFVEHDNGVNIKRLEKGCLILNMDQAEGYRVCVVDNQNSGEAQYWKDQFLKLKPVADNYYQTQNYLSLAKDFVTSRLDEDFEVTKADQIDYLNRSIAYFKKNEQFDEQEFASSVFEHQEVIQSFKKFKNEFQDENDIHIVSEFDISSSAVKRQSRVFKSVLKLDRNFHIYIHGDKNLIEKGIEEDGRKFYKIYYNEES